MIQLRVVIIVAAQPHSENVSLVVDTLIRIRVVFFLLRPSRRVILFFAVPVAYQIRLSIHIFHCVSVICTALVMRCRYLIIIVILNFEGWMLWCLRIQFILRVY